MPPVTQDCRNWSETDRPGERLTIARPVAGLEVVGVSGSNRHWREAHDSLTLAVVHRNQGGLVADWRTRGRSLSTSSGDIMAIEPGEMHVTERLKLARGVADFDIVRFSPWLVTDAARKLGLNGEFHLKQSAVSDEPTFAALEQLVATVAQGKESFEVACASAQALHVVISRLGELSMPTAAPLDPVRDYRLRRVRDYLRAHLDKRPTLNELEAVAELCQWRLCVVFKHAYGISIGQYWNALRLAEAVRRLQSGTPVKLLVAELGYSDEPYFWRVFKAHYGLTPGGWLSLYRANDRLSGVLPSHIHATFSTL